LAADPFAHSCLQLQHLMENIDLLTSPSLLGTTKSDGAKSGL
jgi:hypothetical protein